MAKKKKFNWFSSTLLILILSFLAFSIGLIITYNWMGYLVWWKALLRNGSMYGSGLTFAGLVIVMITGLVTGRFKLTKV